MAAQRFLGIVNGIKTLIAAIAATTGVTDAYKIICTGSDGKLDNSFLPAGIGAEVKVVVTSENFAANDLINIYNDGGTEKGRKADASNGYRAHGYVKASSTSGQNATIYMYGIMTGLSGLVPGASQYLSATAGERTGTAPSTAGYILQEVGTALSATEMSFNQQDPITLA